MTFDALLIPTDGSDSAEAAAQRGFDLAEELAATVHLLRVIDTEHSTWLSALSDREEISDESLREDATDALDALAADATERGLDVRTTVTEGTPSDGIAAYVESEAIDLIAMGTAGRSGFNRLLLGSVTDQVVRTASVPVMTVHAVTSEPPEEPVESENE